MTKKTEKSTRNQPAKIPRGRLYIIATLNNTLITFTNEDGKPIAWGSTGRAGFKGSRKSTPYASTVAIDSVVQKMKAFDVKQLELYLKGPGPGRDAALRLLRTTGFKITKIADITPLPHNGTRPRKQRRN